MDFFDNEQVGKRLRHLRCIMDISVSEMADSLGVTTGHFRKWERGPRNQFGGIGHASQTIWNGSELFDNR